ncbi:MAG: glutathione S-transferase family protein [Steroidobacteraceae bacterium]
MPTSTSRSQLTLVLGDLQLSSWSLRPWILLKHLGLAFEEIRLRLDTPEFEQRIGAYSPTRRVPVLLDGSLAIWDSLAICEYANELADGNGWPAAPAERAHARAISAEMHSGFAALRTQWPMQAASTLQVELTPPGRTDVARIDALWQAALGQHAAPGPWLFGRYSIADAMYAPVVLRFNTYGADLSPPAREYVATALRDPCLKEWVAGAQAERAASR